MAANLRAARAQVEMQSTCCPGDSCPDGPPLSCSHECAAIYIPFMAQCGEALMGGLPADKTADLEGFRQKCAAARVPQPELRSPSALPTLPRVRCPVG